MECYETSSSKRGTHIPYTLYRGLREAMGPMDLKMKQTAKDILLIIPKKKMLSIFRGVWGADPRWADDLSLTFYDP